MTRVEEIHKELKALQDEYSADADMMQKDKSENSGADVIQEQIALLEAELEFILKTQMDLQFLPGTIQLGVYYNVNVLKVSVDGDNVEVKHPHFVLYFDPTNRVQSTEEGTYNGNHLFISSLTTPLANTVLGKALGTFLITQDTITTKLEIYECNQPVEEEVS